MEYTQNELVAVTLAALNERAHRNIADLGIDGNHAFTFLKAAEVEQLRLVQLRNPWGKSKDGPRWTGKFSSLNSTGEWTPLLKEIVRPQLDENDGSFWMELNDFRSYFRSASLCHLVTLDQTVKICRMSCRIVYEYDQNKNTENVSYPKLILDLTSSTMDNLGGMTLEWIGLQQENLRRYAVYALGSF